MIFDGYWKWELRKLSFEISIWSQFPAIIGYAEHRLNRAILYSSTILRKIIEDEIEAEAIAKKHSIPLPKQETTHTTLNSLKYPYTGKEGWTLRSRVRTSDYGIGHPTTIKAKDVCNWLIHSYVWSIVYQSKYSKAKGFLVASDYDKEKFIHFISFNEWKKILTVAIQKSVL